jgi:purine-binding chemotaxis protein CheW
LIREPNVVAALDTTESPLLAGSEADFYSRCSPEATLAERATFGSRALQLTTVVTQQTQNTTEEGVLVVQIGNEYIGFPLACIIDVDALDRFSLSPVPVAPAYIVGQINWRGEILPVVELSSILQIPSLPRQELVIVQIDDIKLGIGVDRIFDVFYLNTSQIDELPISVSGKLRTYLRGVTKYADGLMYLFKLQESIEREFLAASA